MEGFGEKERIIARILKGELSFSDKDVKDLEKADLTEEKEKQLSQLATEIISVAEQNANDRKEVENKVDAVENNWLTKFDLACSETDLRSLKAELKLKESEYNNIIKSGVILTIACGIAMPLFVSFLTSSIWVLMLTTLLGISLGIVPSLIAEQQLIKKKRKIKNDIIKIEEERLKTLGYEKENMNEIEVQKKKNLINNIYGVKNLEKELEVLEDTIDI